MTLHQELTDIILKFTGAQYSANEAAGAVIAKIVERLPEKKLCNKHGDKYNRQCYQCKCYFLHNTAIDTLKDLLTEETNK